MAYSLKWKPEAEKEFKALDKSIQQQAVSQFKKLANTPELGETLGNRAGFNLTGYRKLYFFQKKYRIVYELNQKDKEVIIYAVGKRENMKVYQELARRLGGG